MLPSLVAPLVAMRLVHAQAGSAVPMSSASVAVIVFFVILIGV